LSNFDEIVERLLPFDVVCVHARAHTAATVSHRPLAATEADRIDRSSQRGHRCGKPRAERDIVVAHTGYDARPTIEMTWALILRSARQSHWKGKHTGKEVTDFDKESFICLSMVNTNRAERTGSPQVELYEATNGAEGGTQNGKPVIVLTSQGAKSGKSVRSL